MADALLPPSAAPQELAAEQSTARIEGADGDGAVAALWDPDACPPAALGQLRYALDAPGHWPADDAGRREALRGAIPLHRLRGTRAALDRALRDGGVIAAVEENPGGVRHVAAVAVLNSAALDAELATVDGIRGLAERTGRASVRIDVTLVGGSTLALGHAAGTAALSVARVSLEAAA